MKVSALSSQNRVEAIPLVGWELPFFPALQSSYGLPPLSLAPSFGSATENQPGL
ncbi:MAG: hypothetical protein AAFV90_28425 [Cyanobacteria bacterium J06634_5]